MAWRIEFSPGADRALSKLATDTQKRIVRFLREYVAGTDDPRSTGKALVGFELGGLWRYRVGDYRILCRLEDSIVTVFVVRIGHRREAYKKK